MNLAVYCTNDNCNSFITTLAKDRASLHPLGHRTLDLIIPAQILLHPPPKQVPFLA